MVNASDCWILLLNCTSIQKGDMFFVNLFCTIGFPHNVPLLLLFL